MIEIEKPKVDIVELGEDYRYGKFVIEPLERGYGITIGNALRRILLSSLPGVAVNSIRIDGVLHEFSTVPGVKEDVTEIILTLKELSANIDGEGSRTLKIQAQGPCTVTGADIICPPDVEILNKKSMTDHGDIEERMKESEQNYYKTCINIEVHFEEQESGLIQEYFPDCQIEKMMNGVCRTFIGVPAKERLWKALLLSFGDRVKVVAPEEYKRELIDTARNFLSNYDS